MREDCYMSIQYIKNVKISGVAAAVPESVFDVRTSPCFSSDEEAKRYIENVGVERIRCNDGSITCSDLCLNATKQLLSDLNWDRDEIDMLVFLSQSQDYILPATACVLHGKMGLKQECTCFDISLGCSGWTYGLAIVAGMMQTGAFRKVLLLMGDIHPDSEEHRLHSKPLFGNAGTVTALEYDETSSPFIIDTRTDGSGYESIIRREGGCRFPFTPSALEYKEDRYGNIHRSIDTEMDGPAVFIFGITKVPRAIKNVLKLAEKNVDDVDCFLFHQANYMLNEQIRRKCGIPVEKCPYSLQNFGNNSSASIPLTMVTAAHEQIHLKETSIVACAFGVGLSWGTLYMKLHEPYISKLVIV